MIFKSDHVLAKLVVLVFSLRVAQVDHTQVSVVLGDLTFKVSNLFLPIRYPSLKATSSLLMKQFLSLELMGLLVIPSDSVVKVNFLSLERVNLLLALTELVLDSDEVLLSLSDLPIF